MLRHSVAFVPLLFDKTAAWETMRRFVVPAQVLYFAQPHPAAQSLGRGHVRTDVNSVLTFNEVVDFLRE